MHVENRIQQSKRVALDVHTNQQGNTIKKIAENENETV